ncbi:NAD(P)/FAD-dependent oxidoreductase [Nocardioides sp. NPDC006303]|uniref:flavin-containing monooxygenase n=1 Tax=Nocardioides sp. NPDC006303 TaxID=3156747 RepID=UPI0033B13AEF
MSNSTPEHFDVVIVGAGISGIGAAVELKRSCPCKSFVMIDMRDDIGGTWDLFRYPGIRSDSDMFTLGFGFKPWTAAKAIASGPAIKEYLGETLDEHGLAPHLRLGTKMRSAAFDSEKNRWTLELETAEGVRSLTCNFLYSGSGYYSYRGGFNPELPGEDSFAGVMVHPQQWPEDLAYAGKRVAVIGSGATAVTLVPSMAGQAELVTMVQRSPTYLATEPDEDEELNALRAELGAEEAFKRIRLRNLAGQQEKFQLARRDPESYKQMLFDAIDALVGREIRERHFTPSYAPWDQRVCFVPNGDLFEAITDGTAEIVTGAIDTLEPAGIRMSDGTFVDADIIVKATGLNLAVGGEADYFVDGEKVDFSQRYTYKGLGYSGVPNLFFAFGFLNSSWTLRLELVNRFWVGVLQRMDDLNATKVTPTLDPACTNLPQLPFIADVNSGYFQRALDRFPRQTGAAPWINPQDYEATKEMLEEDPQDGFLIFSK